MKNVFVLFVCLIVSTITNAQLKEGEQSPEITLPNAKDSLVNLSSYHGKIVLVDFWASWCGVCTKEFKDIIKYAKNNPNETILAISIDDESEDLAKYLTRLDKTNNLDKIPNLLFIWDSHHAISQDLFNTTRVPETYLVNKDYIIIKKTTGRADWR